MESIVLLRQIIDKGGLLGASARMHLSNEEKAKQFILECSALCHNPTAIDLWGEELINSIKKFSKSKT